MSDETTASEPTNEPAGELNGPDRTIALAKAALQAHIAERQHQAKDKEARIAERIASVKALLLNVWDMLGIDPSTCTVDEHERPTWSGSLTLIDPDDPRAEQNTVTLETSVSLHQDGLYLRADTGSATLYNKRGSGSLPENPPSDEAIGDMVLNGWISALQSQERERQSTLDSLINSANIITGHYNSATEDDLEKLAVRVAALKPGDLPDPYDKSLAKVDAALAKASQRVEARLKYEADYVVAATKVKLLAAKWQRRYAAWDDECSLLARSLTEHHFKPFTIYEIRYTAIGAPVVAVDEDGCTSMPTEAVHTMQSPLDIRNGARAPWSMPSTTTANPASSSSAHSSTATSSSTPRPHPAPARAPASITHAASGKATTTPTSPDREQDHGRRDHGHALLPPAAGALLRHGARRAEDQDRRLQLHSTPAAGPTSTPRSCARTSYSSSRSPRRRARKKTRTSKSPSKNQSQRPAGHHPAGRQDL